MKHNLSPPAVLICGKPWKKTRTRQRRGKKPLVEYQAKGDGWVTYLIAHAHPVWVEMSQRQMSKVLRGRAKPKKTTSFHWHCRILPANLLRRTVRTGRGVRRYAAPQWGAYSEGRPTDANAAVLGVLQNLFEQAREAEAITRLSHEAGLAIASGKMVKMTAAERRRHGIVALTPGKRRP